MFWEVLKDALKDSAIAFPFIFLIYLFMELVESARRKEKIERALASPYAPLFASVSGVIPECGFSLMCAKLYSNGLIKTGTLIAAFIATSDEGLIVLLSEGAPFLMVLELVGIKIAYGAILGVLLNFAFKKFDAKHVCPPENHCIECGEEVERKVDKFLIHPLVHSLKTFAFILVFNLLFGGMFALVGEEKISDFIAGSVYLQPLLSSLVGLIPNCASSIVIAQAFGKGVLGFAGLLSGLCSNAGVGLLILFKDKSTRKKSFLITAIIFAAGVAAGYVALIF